MLKLLPAAALAALIPIRSLAATPPIVVQSPAFPRQLSVSATATESANPDMATVGFTIRTQDSRSAATAISNNNAVNQRFTAQAAADGVPSRDLRTTSFNVSYDPPPMGGVPMRDYGYTVTRTISAQIHTINRVGAIIDDAIAAGVNNINDVSFGLSNNHALLMRALGDAVAQARASAQSIAAAAGVRLLQIHSISEGFMSLPTGRAVAAGTMSALVPTTIEPTNVSVQASVNITYDIR